MMKQKKVRRALKLAIKAHQNKQYHIFPYILHPLMVASRLTGKNQIAVALLHDVVEDSEDVTLATIRKKCGGKVAAAVDALTKRKVEDYFKDYLPRLKKNPLAWAVKLADLEVNIFTSLHLNPDATRLRKYLKARAYMLIEDNPKE